MSIGSPGAFFPLRAWRSGGRSGQQTSAAPHAPPRSFLRVPSPSDSASGSSAHQKGHAGSVSVGRSELSELLPHPPGAVTPDVALRSALFSPLLRSTRRQQAERRAVRRYVRALQRCMPGTDGRIPGFTCQHKTKCILLKKIEGK